MDATSLMSNTTFIKAVADTVTTVLVSYASGIGESARTELLSQEYLADWAKVFIPKFIDYYNNYERMENLGDRIFGNHLTAFLHSQASEDNTEGDISDIYAYYSSNVFLRGVAVGLKLEVPFGIANTENLQVGPKVLSDIFEAFVGCLYLVAEKIKTGYGDIYCRHFVYKVLLGASKLILMDFSNAIYKRHVRAMSLALGTEPTVEFSMVKGATFKITLGEQIATRISEIIDDYYRESTFMGVGPGRREAEAEAWKHAYEHFGKYGLDPNYLPSYRQFLLKQGVDGDLWESVLAQKEKQGYGSDDSIYAYQPSISEESSILQLLGLKGGKVNILASVIIQGPPETANNVTSRTKLLTKYIT